MIPLLKGNPARGVVFSGTTKGKDFQEGPLPGSGSSAIRIDSALVHRYNRDSGVTNMSRELAQTILGPLNVSIFLFGLVIFLTRKKGNPRKRRKYIVVLFLLALFAGVFAERVNEINTVSFSSVEDAVQYAYDEGAELILQGTDSCFVLYPTPKGSEIVIYAYTKNGAVKRANTWVDTILSSEGGFALNVWFVQAKGSEDQYVNVSTLSPEKGLALYDNWRTEFSVLTKEIEIPERHITYTYLNAVGLLDMTKADPYTIVVSDAAKVDRLTVERQADGSFVQVK